MLLRRFTTLALLAGLPIVLANCSSDSTGGDPPSHAGAPSSTAGTGAGGSVGVAGQASAGAPAGGSISVVGGGSTSVAGSGVGGSLAGGGASGSGGSAGTGGSAGKAGSGGSGGSAGGSASGFTLTSVDQAEGAKFDGKYTCNGGNLGDGVIPELVWAGAPSGTMSFAITFIDTSIGDTKPMGQHWAIWNIPATVTKIPEGTKTLTGDLAPAKQSGAFLSPCAISVTNNMDDQYEFTVWAIPTATLNVGSSTTVASALTALKALSPKPATATLHGHAGVKGK